MLFSTFVVILLVLVGSHSTNGAKGVDVSTYVPRQSLKCLKKEGYDLLIVRGYRSNGRPDSNARRTLINARWEGFYNVDVYMFPCPKCGKSAAVQVREMGKFCNTMSFCSFVNLNLVEVCNFLHYL